MSRRISALFLALGLILAVVAARPRPVRVPPHVAGPTFSKEVVRVFQARCQTCHHPGDIAPFSLMTYADAHAHAADIKYMTQSHLMPPWKAAQSCGEFADARVMTPEEIDLIARWVDDGAQEGNRSDLPTPLDFGSGWANGTPDLVLSSSKPYTPPPTGDMYRCFPMPVTTSGDQYVSAIDVHPGDRQTVHHVIAFVDTTGESVKLDDADPEPGYTCFGGPNFSNPDMLGGWAPGARPMTLPDNVALSLPAGSRIVLQVHYHPHGTKMQPDQTEIGIYLSKKKPSKIMRIFPLVNQDFTIPPNDASYRVTAGFPIPLPLSAHLWGIWPHMHLLGRKMSVEATLPNGKKECLINIDDWDFNWQGMYRYKDAVALPALTRLTATAYYDNSSANWRNPNDPPKPVSWGEQTTDEMCLAFLGVTFDAENLSSGKTVDTRWIPPLFARQ